MSEKNGIITFKGNPMTLLGPELKVGDDAPDFAVVDNSLTPTTLASYAGKVKIISAVPSLDTPVCDTETRRFNQEAASLPGNVVVLTISADLPFAQKRWCGAAGIDKVITLSDYRDRSFGLGYGVLIKELLLLTRAVFVLDAGNKIRYIQIVPEVTAEPDYAAAIAEITFTRPDGSALFTATTAIALRRAKGAIEGWVIVIEDLTNLIQAERAAAWSEVARRMAHEIKNPLTPIQLSAERIIRNYKRGTGANAEARFDEIVREGTTTIVREVATLQRMVEEFSRFARLPEAQPVESSLNEVVKDAIGLYDERLNGIRIERELAEDLPLMRLDPEQFKRLIVNLIDNAIEAIEAGESVAGNGAKAATNGTFEKLIKIETLYEKESELARLIVSDTGHGIRPADRDKLFLPKFSTRDRGTGLGLAIVSHIVADHKGRIQVEDNRPRGARFIIELPVS